MISFEENISHTEREEAVKILPNWKTHIFQVNVTGEEDLKELQFLVAAPTKEEFKKWLTEFEDISKTTYSVRSTERASGKYVLFKQRLVCHHNTKCERIYDPTVRNNTRNTNCGSGMTATIHAVKKRYQGKNKSKALLCKQMPCEISLFPQHNHSVGSVDSLRFRRPSPEIKNKLLNLFHKGHSPATALETIKLDIQLNCENYNLVLADRKQCPDYDYCYNVYVSEFKRKYGPLEFNSGGKEFLENRLEDYNSQMNEICARMVVDASGYVICICCPLAKRVHQYISAASQMVFMDCTGSLDRDGSRLFVLLTHSECGGLPLGIIISSSESAHSITVGFELLKEILGDSIFGGNPGGPSVFVTGDSLAEQTAIQTACPNSRMLLCIFHVLQSVWIWLMKPKNAVPKEKQLTFFKDFKAIMFAKTIEECLCNYKLARDNVSADCSMYSKYLEDYWERRELWALAYRSNLALQGNNSNNFSELIMRILKDKVFDRVRAFNVIQMVDFIVTKFVSYFERRLLDAANNRSRRSSFSRAVTPPPAEIVERIQKVDENIVFVPSETVSNLLYVVNMDVLMCSCFQGNTGKICKHIDWASTLVPPDNYLSVIDDYELRRLYYIIATNEEPPEGWPNSSYIKCDVDDTNSVSYIAVESTEEEVYDGVSTHPGEVQLNVIQDSSDMIKSGQEVLEKISELCMSFVHKSPQEVIRGLEALYQKMQQTETPSAFASHCANFGQAYDRRNYGQYIALQPTAISRRQTILSGRRCRGGRSRKIIMKRIWEWIVNLGRVDMLSKEITDLHKSYVVCSEHFERHYFMNEQKRKLVHDAVPTIFTHYFHDVDAPLVLENLKRRENKTNFDVQVMHHEQSPQRISIENGSQIATINSYKCQQCSEVFLTVHHLYMHELRTHDVRRSQIENLSFCKDVQSPRNDEEQLKVEIRSDSAGTETLGSGNELQSESSDVENSGKQYTCHSCSQNFISAEHLLHHEVNTHDHKSDNEGEQDMCVNVYRCRACAETFTSKSELFGHEIREHDGGIQKGDIADVSIEEPSKEFACFKCDKLFVSKSEQFNHEFRVHSKEIEMLEQDGDDLSSNVLLEEEATPATEILPEPDTSSQAHKCRSCAQSFETKQRLFRHEFETHVTLLKPGTRQLNSTSPQESKKMKIIVIRRVPGARRKALKVLQK